MFRQILPVVLGVSFVATAWAGDVSRPHEILVKNEVVRAYSLGRFRITPSDVWSLSYVANDPARCSATVHGLARRPGRFGHATYQFWVCIFGGQGGMLEAELIDDQQVGD